MKYTSLFLDLDNTLLDFNLAEKVAITNVLKINNLPYNEETVTLYSKINKSYWERFEKGEILKKDIFEDRFITLLNTLKLDGDTAKISKDYFENLSNSFFKIEGADEILSYLKNKGYKLYATTNGISTTQFNRIKNSGLEQYFENVFVSEITGHQKPEKAYFDYVIDNIPEKNIRKILIIGDSQSSDILGGINSGIDTCWYNPNNENNKYQITYQISNLMELKNIL